MTDKTERRIEMLQSHQRGKELVDNMRSMIDLITVGGEEGIKLIAQDSPEVILAGIDSLMKMIERLQVSNDQLLEYWLSSMDNFDEIVAIIRPKD